MQNIKKVTNPLTIIAIFASLTEVISSVAIAFSDPNGQIILIYFTVGFPILLVSLFFLTLNFNPKVLYSPSDFSDEGNYLKLMDITDSVFENYENVNEILEKVKHNLEESNKDKLTKKDLTDINFSLREAINSISAANSNYNIVNNSVVAAYSRGSVEREVINLLSKKSKPTTMRQIDSELSFSYSTLKRVVHKMVNEGELIKDKSTRPVGYSTIK